MRLTFLGNLTLDELVLRRKTRVLISPGGASFYASIAARLLGADVSIISNIGPDYPQKTVKWLRARKIDVSRVVKSNSASARFRLEYHANRRRVRVLEPGEPLRPELIRGTMQVAHLGPVYHEIRPVLERVVRQSRFISLDIQGLVRKTNAQGIVRFTRWNNANRIIPRCDLVKASLEEAKALTSKRSAVQAATRIVRNGAEHAVVTMGRTGLVLAERNGGLLKVPAFPEPMVDDTTGAGDVLVGGWLAAYNRTKDSAWACSVGTALASLTIRHAGFSKFRLSKAELFRRSAWVYARIRKL